MATQGVRVLPGLSDAPCRHAARPGQQLYSRGAGRAARKSHAAIAPPVAGLEDFTNGTKPVAGGTKWPDQPQNSRFDRFINRARPAVTRAGRIILALTLLLAAALVSYDPATQASIRPVTGWCKTGLACPVLSLLIC